MYDLLLESDTLSLLQPQVSGVFVSISRSETSLVKLKNDRSNRFVIFKANHEFFSIA